MIITIQQYIEALTNSAGRWRALGQFWSVRDSRGDVAFSVAGHRLVDFEVTDGETVMTLRCPLRSDAEAMARLAALATKDTHLGSEFFTPWQLLKREVVLFDRAGSPVEVDILIRQAEKGAQSKRFFQLVSNDENHELVTVDSEGRWSLLDRSGAPLTYDYYEWIGELSEGLILAQKDGLCGFLDTAGREAIPFIYDDATSFVEGCAYVTLAGESFFIDGSGQRVAMCGGDALETKLA
ncbi:MAG: WG repeat-containing protein [Rikenellaceae bacterium]|jgi:hypothetical protein|nr:WG repeat-containing protein [Rikenellaceae bacterium]